MKKVIFGTLILISAVACEGTTTEEAESIVNTEAIIEMETVTEEVSEGIEEMESEVEALGEDIDELLNEI